MRRGNRYGLPEREWLSFENTSCFEPLQSGGGGERCALSGGGTTSIPMFPLEKSQLILGGDGGKVPV